MTNIQLLSKFAKLMFLNMQSIITAQILALVWKLSQVKNSLVHIYIVF